MVVVTTMALDVDDLVTVLNVEVNAVLNDAEGSTRWTVRLWGRDSVRGSPIPSTPLAIGILTSHSQLGPHSASALRLPVCKRRLLCPCSSLDFPAFDSRVP
jgi:hypothetical protein